MSTTIPSAATLRRAIEISEKIEKLEAELRAVLDGKSIEALVAAPKAAAVEAPAKKRKMSPEARARIVAAQKARWAKVRAEKAAALAKGAKKK